MKLMEIKGDFVVNVSMRRIETSTNYISTQKLKDILIISRCLELNHFNGIKPLAEQPSTFTAIRKYYDGIN